MPLRRNLKTSIILKDPVLINTYVWNKFIKRTSFYIQTRLNLCKLTGNLKALGTNTSQDTDRQLWGTLLPAATARTAGKNASKYLVQYVQTVLFIFLIIMFSAVYNAAIHISHPSTWSCLNSISSEFPSTVSWTISSNILLAACSRRDEGRRRFVNFLPLFSSLFPDICCAQQFNINIQLLRCCSNGINFCPELKLITSSNLKRVWQVSSSPMCCYSE